VSHFYLRWDKQERKEWKINGAKRGWRSLGDSNPCFRRESAKRARICAKPPE
jgi:hypothetical protein